MFFNWQEDHANAVTSGLWQSKTEFLALAGEEFVGNLNEDAGTISGFRVAAARSAVRKVQKNLNSLADDVVTLFPGNTGYEPDTAGVMLVRGVVEALGSGETIFRV
jgi:hypothetical protein